MILIIIDQTKSDVQKKKKIGKGSWSSRKKKQKSSQVRLFSFVLLLRLAVCTMLARLIYLWQKMKSWRGHKIVSVLLKLRSLTKGFQNRSKNNVEVFKSSRNRFLNIFLGYNKCWTITVNIKLSILTNFLSKVLINRVISRESNLAFI